MVTRSTWVNFDRRSSPNERDFDAFGKKVRIFGRDVGKSKLSKTNNGRLFLTFSLKKRI